MMTGQLLLFGDPSDGNKIAVQGPFSDPKLSEDSPNTENGDNFLSLLRGAEQGACQNGLCVRTNGDMTELDLLPMEAEIGIDTEETVLDAEPYVTENGDLLSYEQAEIASESDWIALEPAVAGTSVDLGVADGEQTVANDSDEGSVPMAFFGDTTEANDSGEGSVPIAFFGDTTDRAVDYSIDTEDQETHRDGPVFPEAEGATGQGAGVSEDGSHLLAHSDTSLNVEAEIPLNTPRAGAETNTTENVVSTPVSESGANQNRQIFHRPTDAPNQKIVEVDPSSPVASPDTSAGEGRLPSQTDPSTRTHIVGKPDIPQERSGVQHRQLFKSESQGETHNRPGTISDDRVLDTTRGAPDSKPEFSMAEHDRRPGEGSRYEIHKMVRQMETTNGVAVKHMPNPQGPGVESMNAGRPEVIAEKVEADNFVHSTSQVSDKATLQTAGSPATGHAEKIPQRDVVAQIVERAVMQVKKGKAEFKIELKPEFLGKMNMQISTENQQVIVRINAETPLVKEALEQNLHQIRMELKGAGLEVEKFEVHLFNESGREKERHDSPGTRFSGGKSHDGLKEDGDVPSEEQGSEKHRASSRTPGGIDYFA